MIELLKIHDVTERNAPLRNKTVTLMQFKGCFHHMILEEPITILQKDYNGVEPFLGYSLLHLKFFDQTRKSILVIEDYQTVFKLFRG